MNMSQLFCSVLDQIVTTVCALSDGHRVVSGSQDKQLRVWNVDSGVCERVLRGHSEVCLHFFSPVLIVTFDRPLPLSVDSEDRMAI
jgi:WD40 repeat protein